MPESMYILSIVTLVTLLMIKEISFNRTMRSYQEERKDLLNRVMAKSLDEYKNVGTAPPKAKSPLRKHVMKHEDDFGDYYD